MQTSKSSEQKPTLRIQGNDNLVEALRRALSVAEPPPDVTTSEWADKHRVLTSENSPEPGPWETDRIPYMREMMDVLDEPDCWKAVYMLGVQLGKTEVLLNRIGKNIHHDPAPMMFAFPDDDAIRDFSKDRILPMLENCEPLRKKVIDRKKKTAKESTIKSKRFTGGYLAMVTARSPVSFRSRPIRDLYMDEVDAMPQSCGKEGCPIDLATRRTTNFPDRKIALASSPGNDGESKIAPEYEASDQRKLYCPCPHCEEEQVIEWENVRWESEKDANGKTVHKAETAHLVCIHCGSLLDEVERVRMVRAGRWVASKPFKGVAGFHMSSLCSLMTTLAIIVQEFIDAQDDPQKLKVFTNTRLAQVWIEKGQEVKSDRLYDRREEYAATVPMGAYVLTAGVDVQDDRIEVTIDGWGDDEENWVIDHLVLWGNPSHPQVWDELDSLLSSTWEHESGIQLSISVSCIDSAGHKTNMVYDYCSGREALRQFAIIGRDGEGRPAISAPSEKRYGTEERPVKLFIVGVDGVKALLYTRFLEKTEPGAGYTHFPAHLSEEYFKQLTSEKLVKTYEKGVKKTVWKPIRPRNEALDCKVYSYAALKTMPRWQERKARILSFANPDLPKPKPNQQATPAGPKQRKIRGYGVRRYGN